MPKPVLVALGVLMILVGALWTGQGLGWIGGSAMTDQTLWAIIGPAVAGLGLALTLVAFTRKPR